MAVPMKNGGMKSGKVIYYVVLSGITTGIGAFFGAIIGGISQSVISMCLSFAAGAMLYIVSGELIPESNKLYSGRMNAIGNIIGITLGIIVTTISVKKFRMKILEIIIDTINRYSKLRDFSLSFVLS